MPVPAPPPVAAGCRLPLPHVPSGCPNGTMVAARTAEWPSEQPGSAGHAAGEDGPDGLDFAVADADDLVVEVGGDAGVVGDDADPLADRGAPIGRAGREVDVA